MISEKESQIDDLKFSKRQAEIDLRNTEKILETGNEVAEINGTVTFVAKSSEEAKKEGSYITIVNDSITSVVGAVNENDLQYLSVGMPAIITSNVDVGEYDAKITHISKELSQGGGYDKYGTYDDTTSYYDVTFELNEKAELKDDEEVVIIIETDDTTESVWVENAFIRTENGKSYVMVANENNIIEKRYVKLGRKFYDASTEVISGISADDRIGLPYGKTVEGMPTVDVAYDELHTGFMF
jgi:multidrug efflux pump subunit AcrA (membrane-fusion protein)